MLNPAQLDHFHSHGYVVVEDLLDAEALKAIRDEYDGLLDRRIAGWVAAGLMQAPPPGLGFWDRMERVCAAGFDWFQPLDISLPHDGIASDTPMHIGPAVFDMITHHRILDLVEQIIGPEITSNPIQHVRIKPPQTSVPASENRAHVIATGWHQDQGVTLEEADKTDFVTVWLAITDATEENGCLQVAANGASDLLPHCTKNSHVTLAREFTPDRDAKPTPVRAGGAVIFHPLTPHGSLANRSDGFRWSFDLRYNVTGQPTGRSQFPEFVARSRANPASELRDWRVWQSMWTDARTRLSAAPHMAQHRWDSTSPHCA